MKIPAGAMQTVKTEMTSFEEIKPTRPIEKEEKKEKEETVKIVRDTDYTVLDWVRVLLILTLPVVNIIAMIIWIAKRPMNRTAGNYAIGFIIYLCIMAAIGAAYYFFIM